MISGIGLIGAGMIFREGLNVRGLNTAATLWCSAAVGVFAGAGMAGPAALCALLVLGVNVGLRPLVQRINRSPPVDAESEYPYRGRVQCQADREAFVRDLLLHGRQDMPLRLVQIESRDSGINDTMEVSVELVAPQRAHELLERIVGRLSLEPTVLDAAWRVGEAVEQQHRHGTMECSSLAAMNEAPDEIGIHPAMPCDLGIRAPEGGAR